MTLIDIYFDNTGVCVDSFLGYFDMSWGIVTTLGVIATAFVAYKKYVGK